MRFVGIDIGSESHVAAIVDDEGRVVVKPMSFAEDRQGYDQLLKLLGGPENTLIGLEATGHYWYNLFLFLAARGFAICVINPLRTRRFADEDLARGKTDSIDALIIARFLQQKRPEPKRLPDKLETEIKELVALRDRLVQDLGDRVRQLHRLVDLGFPEFVRYVKELDSELATGILLKYPTAASMATLVPRRLARLVYDGKNKVGPELAQALCQAASVSVGQHHGEAYQVQVRYACEDIAVLRRRLKDADDRMQQLLGRSEIAQLMITINGLGPNSAARIIAAVGDPSLFRSAAAFAAYVGAIPATRHSGKKAPMSARKHWLGNATLRGALWMPTVVAVRHNLWLRAYYQGLVARGKPKKVAILAAMRKLLCAIYSVAKNRRPFVPLLPAPLLPPQALSS
jgi:transposase